MLIDHTLVIISSVHALRPRPFKRYFTHTRYLMLPIEAPSITAPSVSDASLVDREWLVGGGPVMFTCEYEGIPTPMVRWYHNGEPIQPDSGVSLNSSQLVISVPQVSNSGVYQCVVSNTIDGVVMEDMRQYVLEVREPSKYSVASNTSIGWIKTRGIGGSGSGCNVWEPGKG